MVGRFGRKMNKVKCNAIQEDKQLEAEKDLRVVLEVPDLNPIVNLW